jgi:hypothetical protein
LVVLTVFTDQFLRLFIGQVFNALLTLEVEFDLKTLVLASLCAPSSSIGISVVQREMILFQEGHCLSIQAPDACLSNRRYAVAWCKPQVLKHYVTWWPVDHVIPYFSDSR